MNKRYGLLLIATLFGSTNAYGYHYDVFAYLDESFNQLEKEMSTWFYDDMPRYRQQLRQSAQSNWEKVRQKTDENLDTLAKKIAAQSEKIKEQSAELLDKLKDAGTRSEHHLQHLQEEASAVCSSLTKSGSWLDRMIGRLTKAPEKQELFDLPGKFNATEKVDADNYILDINVPGFSRDNIKLNVQEGEHRVVVTAEKEDISTANAQANGGWRYRSESYFSSQSVNNRTKKIEYKDGKLQVTVDLPDNVDVKNFNSTIDQEKATITFQLKEKQEQEVSK
ncbi:Hsp20 family protein [bacterium]|nr:MAG: Hsp20 family protein [bacterium]